MSSGNSIASDNATSLVASPDLVKKMAALDDAVVFGEVDVVGVVDLVCE